MQLKGSVETGGKSVLRKKQIYNGDKYMVKLLQMSDEVRYCAKV